MMPAIPAIFVLDTSYLVELFKVPGFAQHPEKVKERYEIAIHNNSRFYVPLPCIFEFANHIAHVSDGNTRTDLGRKFFGTVKSCVEDEHPWIITPSTGIEVLPELARAFSEQYVIQEIGLTDTFIIQEADRLKKEKSHFKVHIWTKDKGLKAYEPDTEENPFVG